MSIMPLNVKLMFVAMLIMVGSKSLPSVEVKISVPKWATKKSAFDALGSASMKKGP